MIEEIRIQNFITCKDVKIKFDFPLTALIGKNAAGKSNTLLGIHTASKICLRWEKKQPFVQKGFSAQFSFKTEKYKCVYKYKLFGTNEIYIRDSLIIDIDGNRIKLFNKTAKSELRLLDKKEPVLVPSKFSGLAFLMDQLLSDDKKPDILKNVLTYSWVLTDIFFELTKINYYGIEESASLSMFFGKKDYSKWKKDKTQANGEQLFSFQFYDFFTNRRGDFEEYKTLLKSIELIEDIHFFDIIRKDAPLRLSDDLVVFQFSIHGSSLTFDSLSDGTKRIIRILFHLFYDKSSLMLIEEPESSIHWGLLAKLVSILEQYSDNKRILISTHSEQVLNLLKPEQLIYLHNENNETKARYIKGNNLKSVLNYLSELGPLGEYVTSGGLESDLEDA